MKTGASKVQVPKGTSPSGEFDEPSCCGYLNGKCTNPSCDYWHPPECARIKTEEGSRFGENCAFFFTQILKGQARNRTKDQKSEKATVAIVRSHQTLGCVYHLRQNDY